MDTSEVWTKMTSRTLNWGCTHFSNPIHYSNKCHVFPRFGEGRWEILLPGGVQNTQTWCWQSISPWQFFGQCPRRRSWWALNFCHGVYRTKTAPVCLNPSSQSFPWVSDTRSISQRHTYKTNANFSLAPVVQSKDARPVFTFPALDHWFRCEEDAEGNGCIGSLYLSRCSLIVTHLYRLVKRTK